MKLPDLIRNLMVDACILGVMLNTSLAPTPASDVLKDIRKSNTEQLLSLGSRLRDVFGEQTDVPVLMYHHIESAGEKSNFPYIYTRRLKQFERDMAYLKNHGYNTITIKQLVDFMENGTRLPERPVVITFDDGFESVYIYVYRTLKRNNQKATLAIVVNRVGLKGAEEPAYCSWEQLKEMEDSGVIETVSHSYDAHPEPSISRVIALKLGLDIIRLENESWAEYKTRLKNDLLLSKKTIQEKLDKEMVTHVWPWGYYNGTIEEIAKEVGYKYFLTTENGTNRHGSDVKKIKRRYVFGFTPPTKDYGIRIFGKPIDFASQLEAAKESEDNPYPSDIDIFRDYLRIFEIKIPF